MYVGQNSRENKQPYFTGITKKLSRKIYIDGKKDICQLLEETKPKNTYVGELPPYIFYALPKDKRPECIKDIYRTFDEVSNEIRNFRPSINSPRLEYENKRPQTVVDKLKNMFVKYGIIQEKDPFNVIYLGAGEYKKAFKLEGIKDPKTNDELAYKVFHVVDRTPEWHKYKSHGVDAELNTSIYWKKTHGMETQRGKFYHGNIENGYFLDRYVDEKVPKPKKIINEYDDGIKLTDEVKGDVGHNKLYGYSIDPGGVRVVNRVKIKSPTARAILKKIKETPWQYRQAEWYRLASQKDGMDKRQKQAGLALCVKHMPYKEEIVEECLKFHNGFADIGIGYALKYLPEESAMKYFEILMKRNAPKTQTVLLNEIPLLSRERLDKLKIDDLDVPKGEIIPERLEKFYNIAEKYVLPEVHEHLASYIHLLPKDKVIPAAEKLIAKNDYNINDRLLHKIKFVKDEEFSFGDKMTILDKIARTEKSDFLKEKAQEVKVRIIRNNLDD